MEMMVRIEEEGERIDNISVYQYMMLDTSVIKIRNVFDFEKES